MTMKSDATFPITCPACSKVGNATRPIPPGMKIRCKCGHSFVAVPMEGSQDLAPISPTNVAETPSTELHGQQEVTTSVPDGADVPASDSERGIDKEQLSVEWEATLTDVWEVLHAIAVQLSSPAPVAAKEMADPREYKVVTQKDKWFSGKFDPEKVEGALNAYAKQGWTLKGVATASVPGFGGQRDEIVIIMER